MAFYDWRFTNLLGAWWLGGLIIFDLSGKYLGLYDISSSVTYYTRDTS
jgi:hypothetical protein